MAVAAAVAEVAEAAVAAVAEAAAVALLTRVATESPWCELVEAALGPGYTWQARTTCSDDQLLTSHYSPLTTHCSLLTTHHRPVSCAVGPAPLQEVGMPTEATPGSPPATALEPKP